MIQRSVAWTWGQWTWGQCAEEAMSKSKEKIVDVGVFGSEESEENEITE